MADNAEVVFKFIDGGSSTGGTSGGGGGAPGGGGGRGSSKTSKPGDDDFIGPVAPKSLSQVLKDTAARIGDVLKKTSIGKVGSAIGKGIGEARDVLKGTAAGNVLEKTIAGGKALGGGLVDGARKTIGLLGKAAIPVGVAVAGIGLLGLAARKASDALRGIAEQVGQYSPEFQGAKANNRALKTQQDIERAQRFGTRIARQEEVDGRLDRALTELSDDFTEFFAPLSDVWTELKDYAAASVELLAGVNNKLDKNKNPHKAISELQEKFKALGSIEHRLKFLKDKFANRQLGGELAGDVRFGDLAGVPFEADCCRYLQRRHAQPHSELHVVCFASDG